MRLLTLVTLAACTPPDDPAAPSSSSVRFAPGAAPMALGDVPFPSDLYRDVDGRFALGALPNPLSDDPSFDALRDRLATRGGCTTCAVQAWIDGGLDPASVPASARPGDAPSDTVALVNVDPDSDGFGESLPLRLQWEPGTGRLAARPVAGIVLRRRTRYALVLTDALRGEDGRPLAPSEPFRQARDAGVHPVLEPALDALDALGWPRRSVVGLAPFTTGDPTEDLLAIAAEIRASPRPVATVDRVWTGDAIDTLLGWPGEDRPGVDVPPTAGTDGTRAVSHRSTAVVVAGRFAAPRFVAGSGTDTGPATRDEAGRPISLSDDEVPFVLIVPAGVDPTALPVVVSHHGFNASRTTGFVLADTAGEAGFAVLAIDGFQHGDRAASARDERNTLRDLDGPDGFAETVPLDVSGRMFGLIGAPDGQTFAADLPLAAFEQLAADASSTIRLAREGDWSAVAAADPALAGLGFDPDRVVFAGNSMGAVVGTSVITASPDLAAAVLDVLPGGIVDTLTASTEFRPLTESALLPAVGVLDRFDEVDRAMDLDPTVDLYRWALEPVDPLALAPYLVADRVAGGSPEVLIQLAGHDEVAAPGPSQSVVAASGIGGFGTFDLAPIPPPSGPSAAWRFEDAMHGMLEVRYQTSSWEAPLVPPLAERSAPLVLENPLGPVHDQIADLLWRVVDGG